jgi:toxin ParE1/3/4
MCPTAAGYATISSRGCAVPFERRAVIAYEVETDCVRTTNIFYGGRDREALYRRQSAEENEES